MKRFIVFTIACFGLSTLLLFPASALGGLDGVKPAAIDTTGAAQMVCPDTISNKQRTTQPQPSMRHQVLTCESIRTGNAPFDLIAQRPPTCVTPNGKCRLPAGHAREGSCCCPNLNNACGFVE